ncbi:MAG: sel1 repeat family protein [Polyangiaceae bacterium]|nr:sel1 repeat family protein [Polyangiaceae bacterium]
MRPPLRSSASIALLASVPLAACGAGAAAEAVRPPERSAGAALGEQAPGCHDVARGAEPLVVDWRAEDRGDLEIAMKQGVAVVAYDCKGLRLLTECKLEGTYGYLGMTKREQVVRLSGADEVSANLPFSGGAVGGGVTRASTLDVAMILVGKRRTTWVGPTRADLQGACEGATHWVRGATVGAFVLEQGSEARVRAAAEVFGAGAGGSSESSRQSRTQDGNPKACGDASPDASKPPPQCAAPVRITLVPILAAPAEGAPPAAAEPSAGAAAEPACPAGLVFAEGKCVAPGAAAAYLCDPADRATCEAQCQKGHAGSCGHLGQLLLSGQGAARDPAKAAAALEQGCDGAVPEACAALGALVEAGEGVAKDEARAMGIYAKACDAGAAVACERLGAATLRGAGGLSQDTPRALGLLRRGCDGGADSACAAAATLLLSGDGVAREVPAALDLHRRACAGRVAASCVELGAAHEPGGAAAPNPVLASVYYRRGCYRGQAEACAHLGRLEWATSPDQAKRGFELACQRGSELGCAAMIVLFGAQRPLVPGVERRMALVKACNAGNVRDCGLAGLLEAASRGAMARSLLDRACQRGDRLSCDAAKKLP